MAYENDILTRNDDDELSVRVVQSTGDNPAVAYDDVYTRDDNGKLAVRVVGAGGGSDQHNLGWYATQAALEEAHPTAEAGDWAIVGSTDTVWLWDTDNEEWVDSDTKGQVTSVNNQTGAVTLGINDVAPTQTGKSGYVLGTDGFVAGWVKPETVQVSALPAASEDEVDNIYQFVGTTNANYTNGYFYKCVSDGQDPATYSWTRTDVQPQAGGLPSQTGQSGKFLTTDGTDASWATINALQNTATGSSSLTVSGTATATVATTNLGVGSSCEATGGVALGYESKIQNSSSNFSTAVGRSATVTNANCTAVGAYSGSGSNYIGNIVAVGYRARAEANGTVTIGASSTCGASATRAVIVGTESSSNGTRGIAIGYKVTANAAGAIQIGSNGSSNAWHINSDPETLKIGNANGNFEIMSADGTIPAARHATLPATDGTYTLQLVIADGVPTLSWVAV